MLHVIASLLVTCSVADYGARGDGATDDRSAIQAAINACAEVTIPAGRYLVTRAPFVYYDLLVPEGRTIRGDGRDATTLVQAAGHAPSVRLLHVAGADVTVEDLALDGDRARQVDDEHRAGVFAAAPRLTLRRVDARSFSGDGVYLYRGADDATIDDVRAMSNSRNGLSLGGGTAGGLITGSIFAGNGVQQIDSEPGWGTTVDGVTITGCYIDGSGSNDYALTVSGSGGSGSATRSSGWTVIGNTIRGSVLVVWADGIIVARNEIRNASTKPCIEVYRRSRGVAVLDNACEQTQTAVDSVPAVYVGGATGDMPEGVVVAGNALTAAGRSAFGVRAEGVGSVYIAANRIDGPGVAAAGYAGVYVRTSIVESPLRAAAVVDNVIRGWPAASVMAVGNVIGAGVAELCLLEVSGNTMDAGVTVGWGAAPRLLRRSGNRCTGTCPGADP